uniref:consortin, connexin sorting protein b n=1 Tax=Centroberyx gerrardi TaxID=166262 RepID=UPI003AAC41F0
MLPDQWAIQFLQLEKLYHERLLSNLAALQDNWESQWREKKDPESSLPAETVSIGQEHIDTLSQICRTHHRPSLSVEKSMPNATLKDIQSFVGQWDKNETPPSHHGKVNKPETTHQDEEEEEQSMNEVEEEEEEEEELCEETPEEEEVKVEWPAGVPQASAKDLAKLSHTEGSSSPDGLVSILKRRRASLDGLPPCSPVDTKNNSKRKVRFSEPEDGMEQDEVGGDSCLILLLLCLVTVVISVGGTALYCTLVDTYSNICTDFSHNVDFYVMNVQRFFDELRHWLPLRT